MNIAADERLSARQLAERIGPRRNGRPTHPQTVWGWMTAGLRGVVLRSVEEVGLRLTCWDWYEQFRSDVAAARGAERARRRPEARPSTRRQAAAKKRWDAAARG